MSRTARPSRLTRWLIDHPIRAALLSLPLALAMACTDTTMPSRSHTQASDVWGVPLGSGQMDCTMPPPPAPHEPWISMGIAPPPVALPGRLVGTTIVIDHHRGGCVNHATAFVNWLLYDGAALNVAVLDQCNSSCAFISVINEIGPARLCTAAPASIGLHMPRNAKTGRVTPANATLFGRALHPALAVEYFTHAPHLAGRDLHRVPAKRLSQIGAAPICRQI